MDLSIIIPAFHDELENLLALIPRIEEVVGRLTKSYEILVVVDAKKELEKFFKNYNIKLIEQKGRGYGNALKTGFSLAKGKYFVTMDADFSHDPIFISLLWHSRHKADILIASRYVKGGVAEISFSRKILSKLLNKFFAYAFKMPFKDLSSGFRLYNSKVFKDIEISGTNFDVLQEILIKSFKKKKKILEIPFHYKPRIHGESKAKLVKLFFSYVQTYKKLSKIR